MKYTACLSHRFPFQSWSRYGSDQISPRFIFDFVISRTGKTPICACFWLKMCFYSVWPRALACQPPTSPHPVRRAIFFVDILQQHQHPSISPQPHSNLYLAKGGSHTRHTVTFLSFIIQSFRCFVCCLLLRLEIATSAC